jgi:hypothetical protein
MDYINYTDKIITFFMNNKTNQTEFTIEEIMDLSGCSSQRYTIIAIGKCVKDEIINKIKVTGTRNSIKGHLFSLNK